MKKSIIFLLFFFALTYFAQAQRYLPGQIGWQLTGGFLNGFKLYKKTPACLKKTPAYHLNLSVSKYTKNRNRWMYGVYFSQENKDRRYASDLSYWIPVLGNRGKDLFFSLGIGANFGYLDRYSERRLLKNFEKKFFYGGFLGVELELFLSDRFVFIINARERFMRTFEPLSFPHSKHFHMNLGAGIKYVFIN